MVDSFNDGDFTYAWDKYSCFKSMYLPHVALAYIVMLLGIGCFITRAIRRLNFIHPWLGKGYILAMLWCMATSLLLHNSGLPDGVILSFLWVLLGLSLGWIAINIHQHVMARKALLLVQGAIELNGVKGNLPQMVAMAKAQIASEKTFLQRFFSWKTLHALFFLTSWINIIGRVFVTPITNDFTCHTYPYFKPIDSKEHAGATLGAQPLPAHNPHYESVPWGKTGLVGWGVALSVGPLVAGAIIGAIWSWVACPKKGKSPSSLEMRTKELIWCCTKKKEAEPLNRSFGVATGQAPANVVVPSKPPQGVQGKERSAVNNASDLTARIEGDELTVQSATSTM